MKTYEEMADSALERIRTERSRQAKRKKYMTKAVGSVLCVLVLAGVLWKGTMTRQRPAMAGGTGGNMPETEAVQTVQTDAAGGRQAQKEGVWTGGSSTQPTEVVAGAAGAVEQETEAGTCADIADTGGGSMAQKDESAREENPKERASEGAQQGAFGERISYEHEGIGVSLPYVSGWEYRIVEYADEADSFGVDYRPCGAQGWVQFRYWRSFGVCGMGLKEEPYGDGWMGIYDDHVIWDFISFPLRKDDPKAGSFVALTQGVDDWWQEFGAEAMQILNQAQYTFTEPD